MHVALCLSVSLCGLHAMEKSRKCSHRQRVDNKSSNVGGSLSIRRIRRKLLSGINSLHASLFQSSLLHAPTNQAFAIKIITFSYEHVNWILFHPPSISNSNSVQSRVHLKRRIFQIEWLRIVQVRHLIDKINELQCNRKNGREKNEYSFPCHQLHSLQYLYNVH